MLKRCLSLETYNNQAALLNLRGRSVRWGLMKCGCLESNNKSYYPDWRKRWKNDSWGGWICWRFNRLDFKHRGFKLKLSDAHSNLQTRDWRGKRAAIGVRKGVRMRKEVSRHFLAHRDKIYRADNLIELACLIWCALLRRWILRWSSKSTLHISWTPRTPSTAFYWASSSLILCKRQIRKETQLLCWRKRLRSRWSWRRRSQHSNNYRDLRRKRTLRSPWIHRPITKEARRRKGNPRISIS